MDFEQFITNIQSLSGAGEYSQTLTQLKQSEEFLQRHQDKLSDVLAILEPGRHSLAWLWILDCKTDATNPLAQTENFVLAASTFLSACDAVQVKYAPEKFASVCHKLKDHVLLGGQAARVIPPLKMAVVKVRPSPEHVTPQHGDFLAACLAAKCYSAALPLLEEELYEVEPKKTGLTHKDFLLYCYYGGMIYIGLKEWKKALELLQHAVTAPTQVLSAITVAAYKKLILVSLIVNGQVSALPKYTPAVVLRNVKACCNEYWELQTAYSKRTIEELKQCVAAYAEVFKTDRNQGLAKQVVASLYKRNIQLLTQTYLTLSLQDIATTVQLSSAKEAEMYVLRMIEDGDIFATINQRDGMVSFQEDPEHYNTQEISARINSQVQSLMGLSERVSHAEEHIAGDKAYLGKIMRERHGRFGDADDFESDLMIRQSMA